MEPTFIIIAAIPFAIYFGIKLIPIIAYVLLYPVALFMTWVIAYPIARLYEIIADTIADARYERAQAKREIYEPSTQIRYI